MKFLIGLVIGGAIVAATIIVIERQYR